MSTESMLEASAASTGSSARGWGTEDLGLSMTSVLVAVLGGRLMWPLALHQLVMAEDCHVHVEHCLESRVFTAVPVHPGSGGGWFLGDVLQGYGVNWATWSMPPGKAACVLAVLGLLHMRVKCMIPEELGGDYTPEVSAIGCAVECCCRSNPHVLCYV